MKTKSVTLLIAAILLSVSTIQAKSEVLLRLNLQKGTIYEMTMTTTSKVDQEMMGKKMKMDQSMEMGFSYQVLDVLPNKNFQLEYSILKMKLNLNLNGQDVSMDSESADESNPMNKTLKELTNIKLKIELSPLGSVENIEGLDQFENLLGENKQLTQTMQMFNNKENLSSFISQTFNYLRKEEVKKDTKWSSVFKLPTMMNMETTMDYEVVSIEKENVLLNVTSTVNMEMPIEQNGTQLKMKMNGTQNGTMSINPKDGWVRESNLVQKFDMDIKMKNPQSGEDMQIPMKMDAETKITVVKK